MKKNFSWNLFFREKKVLFGSTFVFYFRFLPPPNSFQAFQPIRFDYAIGIGKKAGKAVLRNRLKRQVREVLRSHLTHFFEGRPMRKNLELLIISQKKIKLPIPFPSIQLELTSLLRKLLEMIHSSRD